MRRITKISAQRFVPLRKSAAFAPRRPFPAWIDSDQGLTFNAAQVVPRIRDSLVLRVVNQRLGRGKVLSDAHRSR